MPAIAVALALTASAGALAAGDAEAGKEKSTVCASCHGTDGNSTNPEWPSLAGQHASYLLAQLVAFKEGERENPLMAPIVANLSREDMADLAAYYASQPARGLYADAEAKEQIARGERLYRGGDADAAVPACMSCHGPDGGGNAPATFPVLAGQHATYLAMQLRAYRAGERTTDPRGMMRDVAERLSDSKIEALARYLQGLH